MAIGKSLEFQFMAQPQLLWGAQEAGLSWHLGSGAG